MKAIQVKYLGATDFKGSRLKAFVEGGHSVTVPFQYEISSDEARAHDVALELINRLGWDLEITGSGMIANGDYVFTLGAKV